LEFILELFALNCGNPRVLHVWLNKEAIERQSVLNSVRHEVQVLAELLGNIADGQ
jgi:hypothetical protein